MADLLRVNPTQILDSNGDPVAGAKLTFYLTGTTTPVTVYTDSGLTTPHDSPLVADGDGYVGEIFYGGASAVKCVITDADDVEIATLDPVAKAPTSTAGASNVTFSPITGNASTDVQAAIAANTAFNQALGTITTAGKALLNAADVAAQKTILGITSFLESQTTGTWNTGTGTTESQISPAKLKAAANARYTQSLAEDGYTIFPNGLVIQWGLHSNTANSETVTFPIEFPNTCFTVLAADASGSGGTDNVAVTSFATTGFTLFSQASERPASWVAFGN